MLPLWGLGGAWGRGVPHPKMPRSDLRWLPSGWPCGGCRFVVFLPRPAASRHREQTSCAALGGFRGGRFWVLGFARPSAGQVAAPGSGQCASGEGGRPGQITNRKAGSAGCCLSRQGLQLQLSSQRIFLKNRGCICLHRRVLAKGPAPFVSSLPPTFCLSRFSNPAASEVSRWSSRRSEKYVGKHRAQSQSGAGVPPAPEELRSKCVCHLGVGV